jgi:hypothetical protein
MNKIELDSENYFYKISEYGHDGLICKLYQKLLFIPIKIHEKIFLKNEMSSKFKKATDTLADYKEILEKVC